VREEPLTVEKKPGLLCPYIFSAHLLLTLGRTPETTVKSPGSTLSEARH
jgi:hypothetical protein